MKRVGGTKPRSKQGRSDGSFKVARTARSGSSPSGGKTNDSGADPYIFGLLPIVERLRTRPLTISKIYILESARIHRLNELYDLARSSGIPVELRSRSKLDQIVGAGINHQGVIAFVAPAEFARAEDLLDSVAPTSLFLVLDSIEDPRNFGAILRTAECAGVNGVFIPERRAVGLTESVAKSSAGAVEYVPVARVKNLNRLLEELKKKGVWIVGAAGGGQVGYHEWDWARPTAIVLGNEEKGIHRLTSEMCDVLVTIPLFGKIDSLNVSVAAGVLLFEAQRQRSVSSEK